MYERLFAATTRIGGLLRWSMEALNQNDQKREDELVPEYEKVAEEFEKLIPLARLFANKETMDALFTYNDSIHEQSEKNWDSMDALRKAEQAINDLNRYLIQSAQRDFVFK